MSIKVLICDQLPLMRDGLRTLLDALPDTHVVATTDSCMQTVALSRHHRPDVVLIGLAELEPGLDLIRRLGALDGPYGPPPHPVVFHSEYDDLMVMDLLREGAKGLINRDATSDEVIAATRGVARGRTVLAPEIVDRLVGWLRERGAAPRSASAHPEVDALTAREREVLQLIGRGLTIDDVAGELYIGISTVRTHLHRIRHKLDLKDRAQLVAFAYQAGLMSQAA
ncbi:response regulator transcription factor [Streptomyces vilmorinianum]|uniref:response regulator transcription factor n=1 Tax=Streptomyces vilmorinianum TaxID=3051092 RepID=UPI0010FB3C0E|nr:response regulator transcription factor [Streptomyces vilmorinianum]